MNKRTTPQRVVERANIVLCSAEGRSGSAICREVGVSRPTVTQWLDRYEAGGVEELLEDRPRSGRPRKITPDDEAEIVRKTLEEKPADATHWSCRLMAKEVGVHPTTISRIWRAHGLQPHRIEYFKLSTSEQGETYPNLDDPGTLSQPLSLTGAGDLVDSCRCPSGHLPQRSATAMDRGTTIDRFGV